MARPPRDLLKLLANGTNREILTLLRGEPTWPRRIAELVGITEGEAQKRLKQMEEHGLVQGRWVHVGKNVKQYTLEAKALRIEVGPDGLRLQLEGRPQAPVTLAAGMEQVPDDGHVVGRDDELRELRELLDRKPAVAVAGIAGVGKTSLGARHARSQARPVCWVTLRGTEGAPQVVGRLAVFLGQRGLDDLVRRMVHLDGATDLNPQLVLLAEGLMRSGALLVVDDAHRATDERLRVLLAFLVERSGEYRVLLLGRTVPRGLPRAQLGLLSLGGLDAADTEALLSARGVQVPRNVAGQVRAKTGGHPLALTLLAETARGRGEGAERLAALLPETRIEAYLWEELFGDLAEEERAFLSAMAVVQGPVDLALAEAVTADAKARDRLFALERRQLVHAVGEAWVLHDVVREFAGKLGRAPAGAHARAAAALEHRGGVDDGLEALRHWLDAGKPDRALALVRREADEQPYRFVDMGYGAAYQTLLERLAPLVKGTDRARCLLQVAQCRVLLADAAQVDAVLEEAAPLLGPRAPAELRLAWMFLEARTRHRARDDADALKLYAKVIAAARAAKDDALVADALHERAGLFEDMWKLAEAEKEYLRALAQAKRMQDLRRTALIEGSLARVIIFRGAPARARKHLEEGLRAAEASGHLRAETNLARTLTDYHLKTGDLGQARESAERYLDIARRLGDPWSISCALADAAMLSARAEDFPAAESMVQELERINARVPLPFFVDQGLGIRIVAAASMGQWGAFERLVPTYRSTDPSTEAVFREIAVGQLRAGLQRHAAEARPVAERLLRQRKVKDSWIREELEAFAGAPKLKARAAARSTP
ncbi:MAG: helix-turn-helix domain-containing protein [Halobacteriales archaeon]|nr:helix-turn-helix domain-containing protein [Halobacteriales archaeon]